MSFIAQVKKQKAKVKKWKSIVKDEKDNTERAERILEDREAQLQHYKDGSGKCSEGWCLQHRVKQDKVIRTLRDEVKDTEEYIYAENKKEEQLKERVSKLVKRIDHLELRRIDQVGKHDEVASELERWKKGVKITSVKVKKVIQSL